MVRKKIKVDSTNVVFLKLETTGLSSSDDVLRCSILSIQSELLYDEFFSSPNYKTWPEAQEINNISPKQVVGLPSFEEKKKEIWGILEGNNIYGFSKFETMFFREISLFYTGLITVVEQLFPNANYLSFKSVARNIDFSGDEKDEYYKILLIKELYVWLKSRSGMDNANIFLRLIN